MAPNKYEKESKVARARVKKELACDRKVRFSSEKEAEQKGQRPYLCPHCNGWHRASVLKKIGGRLKDTRNGKRYQRTD